MHPARLLDYLAWHLGMRPEPARRPARITFVGSQAKAGTSTGARDLESSTGARDLESSTGEA